MRRSLLCLLLLLPHLAAAQAPREAGRLALVAASQNRWAEADVAAERADPLLRKMVLWLRLQSRQASSTAQEYLAFAETSGDWPAMDVIARNAEAVLENNPDDGLALRWFTTRPARTVGGAMRHADALARAGRDREATEAARRGWAETPADATDEGLFVRKIMPGSK